MIWIHLLNFFALGEAISKSLLSLFAKWKNRKYSKIKY